MNYDIKIDLLKLKGAKIMEIQGARETRRCVVIPIDNEIGTIADAYTTRDKQTGLPTERCLNSCYLSLSAFELARGTNSYGQSHYIKPKLAREKMEMLSPEQIKLIHFLGHLRPWTAGGSAHGGSSEQSEDW